MVKDHFVTIGDSKYPIRRLMKMGRKEVRVVRPLLDAVQEDSDVGWDLAARFVPKASQRELDELPLEEIVRIVQIATDQDADAGVTAGESSASTDS